MSSRRRSSSGLSLRNLRLEAASSILHTSARRPTSSNLTPSADRLVARGTNSSAISSDRNYLTAPKGTLNLSSGRSLLSSATSVASAKKFPHNKETKRERKKRLWLSRQNDNRSDKKKSADPCRQSLWADLPDLILEQIFQMLPFEDKSQAALTCWHWSRIMTFRSVWSTLIVDDVAMTRLRFNFAGKFYESRLNAGLVCQRWSRCLQFRAIWATFTADEETLRNAGLVRYKFNLYARDDEEVLDSVRASNALNRVARKLRRIYFKPRKNLHNICQFQRMMTKFCEMNGPLPDISFFSYTFPCDFARKSNEIDIYGTGGMILQDMKNLLVYLPGLTRLELVDLELDGVDAAHVLDEVSEVCSYRLRYLNVVNTSRKPFSLLAVASFVSLKCLVISPHNLGDDLVECLGDMPKFRNLHVLTNSYTECVPTPVDYRVWAKCRRANPRLRVHLITEGKHSKEITFQSRAPVKSIVYDTPNTKASTFSINLAVELYKTDLECYAHKRLPRFHMPKSFDERADSAYLYLVRQCPYIHTLMIRERISSSTVLLLAYTAKNLRYFHVRRNAIILRCEWTHNPEWSYEFYRWLKKNSRSYDDMEREVSQILGFRWYALNDKQFKLTSLNLNSAYYYEGFEEAD